MTTTLRFLAVAVLLTLGGHALAATEIEAIQQQLAKSYPDIRAENISPSPIPGIYELRIGAQIAYVSADGRYLLRGDIVRAGTEENLTEERRGAVRLAALADVGEARMVVFAPRQVKHTISVFTDIDCGYCRKLHREIDQYLAQGIRVRYLFFPRSGPDTESWTKAETVWCSGNRADALTRSKRGEALRTLACSPTPVQQHYSLGIEFGLQGTPAIITDRGELIPGYVPAGELAIHLDGGTSG
jgi:thiol:disulfide interchange protein DsbC